MRKLLTFLITLAAMVFAVMAPASAQGFNGGCFNCGCPACTAPPLSPAVVAFQQLSPSNNGGNGTTQFTYNSVGTGTAAVNRRVYFIFFNNDQFATAGTIVTSCTIAGVACDVVQNNGTGNGSISILSANIGVTGGTSAVVVVNFNLASFAQGTAFTYTVDNTTLTSPTPTTGYNLGSSATSNSTNTSSISGGFEIAAVFTLSAANMGSTPSLTATETFTNDFGNAAFSIDHANGVGTNASSSASYSWTTPQATGVMLAAFR
jgi:hypothetical protein